MIDVNAVREGTRWHYLGREVTVTEVTDRFVVFHPLHQPAEVAPVPKFLAGAKDAATAEHDSFVEMIAESFAGVGDARHARVLAYLLERVGPPAPLNVVPPAPAKPEPEPAALPAEPDLDVEAYAVADVADECVVEAEPKPNRFKQPRGDRSTNRWV